MFIKIDERTWMKCKALKLNCQLKKFPRKVLMVGSSALMAVTLALLAATIKYKKELLEDYDPKIVNLLPLVEMILYILFFGLGVGTVPWLLLGELCPVKVKGMYVVQSVKFVEIYIFEKIS